MKIVNSLSGGRTSSYLAMNYKSDYNIFSMVCNEDIKCGIDDKMLMQYAQDKLSNYVSTFGEFVGTPEDPIIIKTMYQLEQKIGSEIIWVRGQSMEQVIKEKKMFPNRSKRFCTTETKIRPIFNYCFMHLELPIKMRVGFRWDEKERADTFTEDFKYSLIANKGEKWRHKWTTKKWREGEFSLINDLVHHYKIHQFWQNHDIVFPKDSNCQMCFWKDYQQIIENNNNCNAQIQWAKELEKKNNKRFRFDMTIEELLKLPIQLDFKFTDGAGCNSGECMA
jgi:hypothetical protein